MSANPYRKAEPQPTMTERVLAAAHFLDAAATELLIAAQEGPERSTWASELRVTAKGFAIWAGKIRRWAGEK